MANTNGLVTIVDSESSISEAYRTLRMNLQFATIDQSIGTLLVSSPAADEGAPTCLANLGVTLAQMEKRIILVDCDLRRPSLHTLFGLECTPGLTTMMLSDAETSEAPLQATSVKGLQLLASGGTSVRPADLLGSQRMQEIVSRLLDQADMILFNAPPILVATDAAILATQMDGVLLVVNEGHTKRDNTQQAIDRLRKVKANLLGAVLMNASETLGLEDY